MKKQLRLFLGVLVMLFVVGQRAMAQKAITAEDKKAIIALFKGVDSTKYRLQFNNSKEVYGKKQIQMAELEQVKKVRTPGGENGYVALAVRDDGVMFVFAVTRGKVESLLGAEKAKQLNAIMAKYSH